MKKLFTALLFSLGLVTPGFAGMGDDPLLYSVTADTLEIQDRDEKVMSWDGYIRVGYDLNKIYLYSEGEKPENESAESENQLLYSRAVAPYWDVQLGVGYDKTAEADHTWGVIALQGLAPYFFETRAALLVGEDRNIGLRVDLEYEALLTQKLILTPGISTDIYAKDTPEMEWGKGVSNVTAGLRLRYEFVREFAPYIGVEWTKNFGNTDDFHPLDDTYATAGLRLWF